MEATDKGTEKYVLPSKQDGKDHTEGVFAKFHDPVYRRRFFQWIWFPVGTLTLGIVISQGGPTFPDIQILTDTDKETGSFFFVSGACGYLVGAVVTGFAHGKMDNNIIMIIVFMLGGVATLVTSYCTNFVAMLFIKFAVAVFLGGIDNTLNAEHMRIWGNHGQSFLQSMHFAFALGGVIGPLFTGPFLAEKEDENVRKTINNVTEHHGALAKRSLPDIFNGTSSNQIANLTVNATVDHAHPKTTDVHYAFLIAGIIMIAASVPFIVMFFKERNSDHLPEEKYTQEIPKRKLPNSVYILLAGMLCLFCITYSCVEYTFSSYLFTFVTDEFEEVSTSEGNYITTFFWAAFAVGRFASIFTSKFVVAVRMLYIHLSLIIIAFIGFTVSSEYGRVDFIKVFTCFAGISMSAVYPTVFLSTESELMIVTGRVAAVILIGGSIGSMVIPYILGYLMKNVSNMWFCYILLTSAAITVCLFLLLLLINRRYLNTKYGTLHEGKPDEKEIKPPSYEEVTHM